MVYNRSDGVKHRGLTGALSRVGDGTFSGVRGGVDPVDVSCILYHRNRQNEFSRHYRSTREEGLWMIGHGTLGRRCRI